MIRIMKASAGSGKTFNLAKTYIRLLLTDEERYSYRHILAVTFTNKATDEMKSRILKELHLLAVSPKDSPYYEELVLAFESEDGLRQRAQTVLCDILHDYGAFAVSTIDRFFQQTLRLFPERSDSSPPIRWNWTGSRLSPRALTGSWTPFRMTRKNFSNG